ncbi:ABC transporter permease [Bacillus bingmayongensis]|uniref:ABC transporter permease n=1 Tax=Bacillus bingmayongensis TaxID=1150157 RepID=UPI001C8D2184|nr:ABC transporter permease [Bacillus bingmayongensis]MBY0594971.1 ABC transporter permease [Bacillus bingmayongensis]
MNINKSCILAKKEVLNALKDFRVMLIIILSTLVFYPGLIIGSTYFQENQNASAQSHIPKIVVKGIDSSQITNQFGSIPFQAVKEKDPQKALLNDDIEGILTISIKKDDVSMNYEYKTNSSNSLTSHEKVKQWILLLEQQKTQNFINNLQNVDKSSLDKIDFHSKDVTPDNQKSSILYIIPYFILIGIIAGSMGIGIDITAGEKEKKTFITLLTSNQTRSEIALGKIMSTSFFGIITSLLTLLGFVLGSFISIQMLDMQSQFYIDGKSFFLLLVVLIPIAFLLSTTIVLLGIISKNVKEANSYVMPLYIVVVFIGFMSTMIEKSTDFKLSIAPIISNVLSIKDILTDKVSITFISLSCLSTIIYTIIIMLVCINLFKKEKYILG